jgi:SAM-dependent methyltransferase
MQHFISKWIITAIDVSSEKRKLSILDVGAADYNGSYRELFPSESFNYLTCDIEASLGVDLVMSSPSTIPSASDYFDLVISGQTFEHCPKFWELFAEMARVCSASGLIVLIAPSAGPEHKFPVDCYRFYPGAFEFLATENDLELLDLYWDERGAWKDLVGVFAKVKKSGIDFKAGNELLSHPTVSFESDLQEAEVTGDRDYLEVLEQIQRIRNPKGYLEIGVRNGDSFKLSNSPSVGLDPFPGEILVREYQHIIELTSNQFFRDCSLNNFIESFDLAFIDGLHLFENVYQDFVNIESNIDPNGMVIIDDIYPNTQLQGSRERQTQFWMGDVWKFWLRLQVLRPDLVFIELNTVPSGLGIVLNLDPKSKVLAENFNSEVRLAQSDKTPIPMDVLSRIDAISPTDKNLTKLLSVSASKKKYLLRKYLGRYSQF